MGVRWSRMSWSERNELWGRWRRGESLRDIAHALRRAPSVVYTAVETGGGIAPRPRRRSRLALTDGAGRGFAPARARPILPRYQPASRSSAVHGLSRSSAKRWAWRLSGGRRRRTCLATEPSTPAVPFVHPAGTPTRHRAQTRPAMVAAADLRLAPMYLSERS